MPGPRLLLAIGISICKKLSFYLQNKFFLGGGHKCWRSLYSLNFHKYILSKLQKTIFFKFCVNFSMLFIFCVIFISSSYFFLYRYCLFYFLFLLTIFFFIARFFIFVIFLFSTSSICVPIRSTPSYFLPLSLLHHSMIFVCF